MTHGDAVMAPMATHLGVADALLRFGAGVDRRDLALLESAFTDDAVVDFRPCAAKLGLEFPLQKGGTEIAAFLEGTGRAQVTSHIASNTRVWVAGDGARSLSLFDATHLVRVGPVRRLRMVNWYEAEAVEAGHLWRMSRLVIDGIWFDGDPSVLLVR